MNELVNKFLLAGDKFMSEMHLSYNHFHNILRLFDILLNFAFTTSEMMGDHYL